MGIAAALTSQTGRIGFIGGWQDSFIEIWAASFEDGALATDPTTNVHMAWVNEQGAQAWNDPDSAFEAAMSLFDEGVDVVFTAAGGGGTGSILAARQHTEATGRQTWAIGVDADEGYLSSQGLAPYVLTSAIKRFDVVVEDSLRQWLNGSLKPKTWFGLANGGLGYSFENSALDPAIAAMEEARQLIVAGVIEPSITTATPSTWRSSHDAIMGVEATKSACVAEPSDLSKGDIITLALHNLRAESIAIGLAHVPASTDRDAMQAIADRDGHIFGALGSVGAFTPNQWTVPAGANYELRSTAGGHGHDAILVVCGPFSGEPVFSEVMQVLP